MSFFTLKRKVLLGLVILVSGITTVVFVAGKSGAPEAETLPAVLTSGAVDTFFQYTPGERGAASIALPSSTIPLAPSADGLVLSDPDNLTSQLTELLVRRAPPGQEANFSPDDVSDILASGIMRFPEPVLFTENDVRTDPSNTESELIAYIESLDSALASHFGTLRSETTATALKALFERGDTRTLENMVSAIPDYLNELRALPVPSQWSAVHLQFLNLWRMKLSLFEAILSYTDDPLKAQLALQHIGSVVEQDAQLQKLLRAYYDERVSL